MLLQFAVGPVCLYIFQTAVTTGFFNGEIGVLAATAGDIVYIILALLGIGSLIHPDKNRKIFILFGSVILFLFGLLFITSALGIKLPFSLNLYQNFHGGIFISTFLLTLSNPLTILFWAGVFSAKVAGENFSRSELFAFATGCVFATLFFLSLIVCAAVVIRRFIPENILLLLNGVVGIIMIYFGIHLWKKKKDL